jgi:uncharacterized small protein (DUF1192 family)
LALESERSAGRKQRALNLLSARELAERVGLIRATKKREMIAGSPNDRDD